MYNPLRHATFARLDGRCVIIISWGERFVTVRFPYSGMNSVFTVVPSRLTEF